MDEVENDEKRLCSVFVSGLAGATNEKVLCDFFSKYGDIEVCDVVQKEQGGIGFLEFTTRSAANEALKADGAFIEGMKISVQHKKSPGGAAAKTGRTKSKSVFVKFMDGKIPTVREIRTAFEVCGTIKDIRMHSSKVYCFIEYDTYDSATNATQLRDPRFQTHYSTQQAPQWEGTKASTIAAAQKSKSQPSTIIIPRSVKRKKPAN
eukprot:TRINITY_DN43552_c0_g1_i1.p1 TRINITY_DN43552_c0_g1~~TRINITY_DN43552_c0_g1_i1.p1  ORF type:complete len:239 (+),score=67.49 TRINITY_DN43552_c0_g1_i1:100-717(+)